MPIGSVPTPAAPARAVRRSLAWWMKLLLLGASLLLGLLAVEGGLRLFGLDKQLVWVPDTVLGWRHVPGAKRHWVEEGDGRIVINSLGYRDRERQLDKPAGTFRIAVFGDSMTEGVQVNLEQTFT